MTLDHLQLGQTFSLIDADTVPNPGSRPERALALASELLETAEVIAGDVVLMTDGEGLSAATLQAAAAIKGQGARLSLVSLDTPVASFETHAAAGNGRVFTLDQTEEFSSWLSDTARTRLEQQDYPLLFWADAGRYMLLLALFPVLILFRRQSA